MPRPADRAAIEAEIGRVRPLGLDELRTLWRTTFRSSPPQAFTGMGVVRVLRPAVDVVVRAELARQVALLRAPAIHSAVGCAVTPSHKIWRRPAPLPCSG